MVLTEEDRVGTPGEGFMMVMKNFEVERALLVAEQLGLAQAAMEDAVTYAKERIAFNKPIITNPRVQDLIEENEIILQQTRHWLYYCLWKLDQGESINADIAMLKSWGDPRACPARRQRDRDLRRPRLHRRGSRRPHLARLARQHARRRYLRGHGLYRGPRHPEVVRRLTFAPFAHAARPLPKVDGRHGCCQDLSCRTMGEEAQSSKSGTSTRKDTTMNIAVAVKSGA